MSENAIIDPNENHVLYYGDNLGILRRDIPDESIDVIYLDSPFNSQSSGHVSHSPLVGT